MKENKNGFQGVYKDIKAIGNGNYGMLKRPGFFG